MVAQAVNQPIRDKNRRRRFTFIQKIIQNSLASNNLQKSADTKFSNSQRIIKSQQSSYYATPADSEPESQQSTVIGHLDAHISITQAQIAHLQKAGGKRCIGDRAEVYRANRSARSEIAELKENLEKLYQARRKTKQHEPQPPKQKQRKQAPYMVQKITTRQQQSRVRRRNLDETCV